MTQSIDLNKMGLVPMTSSETENTKGGAWWWVVAQLVYEALVNPEDMKRGYKDADKFIKSR